MTDAHDDGRLVVLEDRIDMWLEAQRNGNPAVAAVDRGGPEVPERRWYVRMRGEEKEFTTVWLTLGQRTLRYETYFMPAPEENAQELFEFLLRRNDALVGAHFSMGDEDAVYLRGELPLTSLSEDELDRIVGSLYAYVERYFLSALRIGFASRFS
jgi:hypothetical protein